jgi:hypothetical protein
MKTIWDRLNTVLYLVEVFYEFLDIYIVKYNHGKTTINR